MSDTELNTDGQTIQDNGNQNTDAERTDEDLMNDAIAALSKPSEETPAQTPVQPATAKPTTTEEPKGKPAEEVKKEPEVDPNLVQLQRTVGQLETNLYQQMQYNRQLEQRNQQVEQEYNELLNSIKQDYFGTAAKYGHDIHKAVDYMENAPTPEQLEVERLKQEIEDLKGFKNSEVQARKQAQDEQKITNYLNTEVSPFISSNAEKYPLLNALGNDKATEVVWSTMMEAYNSNPQGQPPTVEQVCEYVENEWKQLVEIASKTAQPTTTTPPTTSATKPAISTPVITNDSRTGPDHIDLNEMSDSDREELAVKYLASLNS